MNLGVMQVSNQNLGHVKTKAIDSTRSFSSINERTSKFNDVLNKTISGEGKTNSYNETTKKSTVDIEKLEDVLNADSLEEALDILGISHDAGLLTVQVGEQEQAVSVDEMLNLNDLLSILNIDLEQLSKMLEQLMDGEQPVINELWQLINLVNEQGTTIMNQITSSLQGEHKITPKESEQLLQLLKVVQLAGKNADLTNTQSDQLLTLKDLLTSVSANVEKLTKQVTTIQTSNLSFQGLQQVVKQTITTTTDSSIETTQSVSMQNQLQTKTFTITLPTEKSAQGEALVKEVQQLIGRGQFSNTQGTMKLLLKLYPENLGSIRIEIMQKDGVLSARLLASTPQAKELLDNQLHQLKTAFAGANIQVDRIDIAQSLQDPDRSLRDQNLFSNFFKQQHEQENEQDESVEEDGEDQISFQDYLINEEV